MSPVKNTHRRIFRKFTYKQRCIYVILTVLLFAGPLMTKFALSNVMNDSSVAMYGGMLQWVCIFGILYLLWSVQAVRAHYVALLALVLSSLLIYRFVLG
jgi:hypothetical protein